ncbi:MAG: hypothetical protein PV345_01335 [Wolbachia sp.]|nr:hypothetical protein [Wolbachia sp.]
MRDVKLNFLLIFLLIFGLSYQGHAECPSFVRRHTELEAGGKKALEGFLGIVSLGFAGNFSVDEKLYKYISVLAIKDQGVDGYFNPKVKVCDYEENNCHELYSGTSCQKIYGMQGSGAGISTAVFIDWEGAEKLTGEMAQGLEWEWAKGVTDEEKKKFAKSPKICACSQKSACLDNASKWSAQLEKTIGNIFRPGIIANVCDTCYQTKIKCAPIPLAPGPPPFCDQLKMSPQQVRVVPITNEKNDYFNPKVKVIIGGLKGEKEEGTEEQETGIKLGFPKEYGKDKAKEHHHIKDEDDATHYFKTYREKDNLCAEYHGTQGIDENKNLQFTRCFPAPHTPQPEIVEIKNGNTLAIKIQMNKDTCSKAHGIYSSGFCTFDINNYKTEVGPLSLAVVRPKIVNKITDSNDSRRKIDNTLKEILKNNSQFKILEKYNYVPNIQVGCTDSQISFELKDFSEEKAKKCGFDNTGQSKIDVRYENANSKMLCLSGWQPEPEEFFLERKKEGEEREIVPLKSMGARYVQYITVYSKESKQPYYYPCNNTVDILTKSQQELDEIVFDKREYISIPEDNKDRNHCVVDKDTELDEKKDCYKCKIVYKLTNMEYKDSGCKHGDDGCVCFNKDECSRSTQYIDKRDNKPFYLQISQKSDGTIEQEVPTKADRTEVFYADKLCRFDLSGLIEKLQNLIKKQLKKKKLKFEKDSKKSYEIQGTGSKYTNDLSKYDYVEIEAWGGGEAGHIKDKALSTENRPGMPGDYIKAKLKIDPDYPLIIQAEVTDGGSNRGIEKSDKNGGPTIIKICDSQKQNCRKLITVAGGGVKTQDLEEKETKVHVENFVGNLKLIEEKIIKGNEFKSTEDNRIAYIENGEIKYKKVSVCDISNTNQIYGAGGCINKSGSCENYSKGSPGYVEIRPKMNDIDESKVNDAVGKVIEDPSSIKTIDDYLIKKLDPEIIETIENQIKKELLGISATN